MASFTRIPMAEAQIAAASPRKQVDEQYRQYVRQVATEEQAGRLVLEEDDKPISVRAKLKRAAKSEGLTLTIQRQENTLLFWVSDEEPEPVQEPTRRRRSSSVDAVSSMLYNAALNSMGQGEEGN